MGQQISIGGMAVFNYKDSQLRTELRDGEIWFVAKDVCEILEISKHRDAISRLDDDERGSLLVDTLGGKQEMAAVNEPGLYALVLGSRKPEAKAFKRWITHEVIPTIRKTGAYVSQPQNVEQYIIQQAKLMALQAESVQQIKVDLAITNQQLLDTTEQVENIKDILVMTSDDWRKWVNKTLNKIGQKTYSDIEELKDKSEWYREIKIRSYDLLEDRARCKLKIRVLNKRNRMYLKGASPSRMSQVTYLNVIEDDVRLKEIYTAIVKEMAIKYL